MTGLLDVSIHLEMPPSSLVERCPLCPLSFGVTKRLKFAPVCVQLLLVLLQSYGYLETLAKGPYRRRFRRVCIVDADHLVACAKVGVFPCYISYVLH